MIFDSSQHEVVPSVPAGLPRSEEATETCPLPETRRPWRTPRLEVLSLRETATQLDGPADDGAFFSV